MRGMYQFLKENWLEVGTVLAGSISVLVAIAGHFSGRSSEKADFRFSVDESYERVWSKHNGNPALQRVTDDRVDLEKKPVSLEEERFILLLLNHLTSTVKAIELGKYEKPDGMEADVINFFKKPIPRAVANKYFDMQSQEIRELLVNSIEICSLER